MASNGMRLYEVSQTQESPRGAAPFNPVFFMVSVSFFSISGRSFGLKNSTTEPSVDEDELVSFI